MATLGGSAVTMYAQGVGINTVRPHPSARLDIYSTHKGLLLPKLTTAQRNAISLPADGLLVYNLDSGCVEVYRMLSSSWRCIGQDSFSVMNDSTWCYSVGDTFAEKVHDALVDRWGNVILIGSTRSFGALGEDVFVVRISPNDSIIWAIRDGGIGDDIGMAGVVDNDGNIYVVGYSDSLSSAYHDVWVAKYDSSGNRIWGAIVGTSGVDSAYDVVLGSNGDLVVCGVTIGGTDTDGFVFRMDSAGTSIWWGRRIQTAYSDAMNAVDILPNGNIIVGGYVGKRLGDTVWAYVAKLSSAGALIWGKGIVPGVIESVKISERGTIVGVGAYHFYLEFGVRRKDMMIFEVLPSGKTSWIHSWGHGKDLGTSLTFDVRENIYLAGVSRHPARAMLVKLTPDGYPVWSRMIGSDMGETAVAIIWLPTGRLLLAGTTHSFGMGQSDAYLARVDATFGKSCCQYRGGGGHIFQPPFSVASMGSVTSISLGMTLLGGGAIAVTPTILNICFDR